MATVKEQKEETVDDIMLFVTAVIDDAIIEEDIGKVRHMALEFVRRYLSKLKLHQLKSTLEHSQKSYSHLIPPED